MNRSRFLQIWTRLFRRIPGPVALVWGLCTVIQFAIIARLSGQPIESFGVLIGGLGGLLLVDTLQKGLYAPVHRLAQSDASDLSVASALGMSLRRLGPLLLAKIAVGALFAAIVLVFVAVGAPLFACFVVLQMIWFILAPAMYFVAVRRDAVFTAIGRALGSARRHLVWIVGIPTVFWIVGAVVDQYVWEASALLDQLAGADALAWARAFFLYALYRYFRWISVAATYIGVDAADSKALESEPHP